MMVHGPCGLCLCLVVAEFKMQNADGRKIQEDKRARRQDSDNDNSGISPYIAKSRWRGRRGFFPPNPNSYSGGKHHPPPTTMTMTAAATANVPCLTIIYH